MNWDMKLKAKDLEKDLEKASKKKGSRGGKSANVNEKVKELMEKLRTKTAEVNREKERTLNLVQLEKNKLAGAELDAKNNEFDFKATIDGHKTTITNKQTEINALKEKVVYLENKMSAYKLRAEEFNQIAAIKVKGDVQLHKKRSENQIR